MEDNNKEPKLGEGLIPTLFKKWAWKKRFTKKELEELEKIKKESYLKKAREHYKNEGEKKAKEDFDR